MKTEIVIIGGGIVGCSAAYYLAQKGLQVTVVEKDSNVGLQASGRNGGGVRQHGRKAILPLAMKSVQLWAGLSAELQCDLEYYRTGNLNIALDELNTEDFEREVAWEHQHGLKEVRMLTAAECYAMVPGLTGPIVAGKFCPSDGIANPMRVTPAYGRAGIKLGVQYIFNAPVTDLLMQGAEVCGVKTDMEEIEARVVINAAGPWAARFNAQVDCPTPIYPGRSQILITGRLPRQYFQGWLNIRGFGYLRPTAADTLVLGTGGARNDAYSQHVDPCTVQKQANYWCSALPWLRDVPIIRAFAGITEYTPDAQPYIGAIPGVSGLFVAAGFHGEGFCTGPMVGQILAELVTGQEPCVSLSPFQPDRFVATLKAGKPLPTVVYTIDKMFLPAN